jgi:hypothetical protein
MISLLSQSWFGREKAANKRIYASMADVLTMSNGIYFVCSFGRKNSNEQ